MRVLIGVCSCRLHAARRTGIRNTWMRDLPKDAHAVFFTGGAGATVDEPDLLSLDVPDDYEHLAHKVHAFYRHALEHFDFEYLFKCDDDTYVHAERLLTELRPGVGLLGSMQLDEGYASGGAGYLLSHEMVRRLVEDLPSQPGPEDVFFTSRAVRSGLRIESTERLQGFGALPTPSNNLITGHWCSPQQMQRIHEDFVHDGASPPLTLRARHRAWSGEVRLYEDGTFRGGASDPDGKWCVADGGEALILKWHHWPVDYAKRTESGFATRDLRLEFVTTEDGIGEAPWRRAVCERPAAGPAQPTLMGPPAAKTNSGASPVFFTVTNADYFAGTVAALSSIRIFHAGNPIWVFAEERSPLTPEQVAHLVSLPDVRYLPASEMTMGWVKEAWQMKAHAAKFLAARYEGVLIQVDSDAILCACLDDLAADALSKNAPVGGQDGVGASYRDSQYHPYKELCSAPITDTDHHNPLYLSTSIIALPTRALAEVIDLWSEAVDKAEFGPTDRPVRIYAGYGDQGVLNAILYFKGVKPILIENDLISQHWTHGKQPVAFANGGFHNGGKVQLAFHSVGHSPKFWRKEYAALVDREPNLREVYDYWLYLLFDGPCGLHRSFDSRRLNEIWKQLYPNSYAEIHAHYLQRREGPTNISSYHELGPGTKALPLFSKANSTNVIFAAALHECGSGEADRCPLHPAIKALQSYRMHGGKADLVVFVDALISRKFSNPALADLMEQYGIRAVNVAETKIGELFLSFGINIDALRIGAAAQRESARAAHGGESADMPEGLMRPFVGDFAALLLADAFARSWGYEQLAIMGPGDDASDFGAINLSGGFQIDDLWRFSEFTDFVYHTALSGKGGISGFTAESLSQIFQLRQHPVRLPISYVTGRWLQATAESFAHFVSLATDEMKRQYLLGYQPAAEVALTAVMLAGRMWPPHGSIACKSLQEQLAVVNGLDEQCEPAFRSRKGEDKYSRFFLTAPSNRKRYAISICGFDGPGSEGQHYSTAAMKTGLAYRQQMEGTMDVHIYTNNAGLPRFPGITVHCSALEDLTTPWDERATYEQVMQIQLEARSDRTRHKDGTFLKRPEYALAMASKLMAMEKTLRMGYDGALCSDADGDQFSLETIGCLGRRHIDGIWPALDHHPMFAYIVGTARYDSFNTWISILRKIAGGDGGNDGPLDWMWGGCYLIEAAFGARFYAAARSVFRTILDRRIVFYDEHLLNCTYNRPEFDDDLLRGMRDFGDPARIGYREMSPRNLLRYKRWSSGSLHTGRRYRRSDNGEPAEFSYRT